MFYRALRFSCVAFLLTGCSSITQFTKTGDGHYCLVNYKNKTIDCSYNSIKECSEQYNKYDQSHCFRARDLVNKLMRLERKN